MRTSPDPMQRGRLGVELARYTGLGLSWALSTVLFMFGGLELDRWVGTLPLFTVVGALVGASAGFYSLYRHLVVEPREREDGERSGSQRDGDSGDSAGGDT